MAAYDVRIITAGYRREPKDRPEKGPRPVIQLFGRTSEGKSIAIEDAGVKTPFFAGNPPSSLRAGLEREAGLDHLEANTLEVGGRPAPCVKVVLHHPWRT